MNYLFFVSGLLNIVLGFRLLLNERPRTATADEVAQMRARLHV